LPDTDNDGVPDVHDLDSDNDGITDTTEAGLSDGDSDGRIDNFTDPDGDGYDNAVAAAPPVPLPDTDADNTPDVHDLDSDNDGETDTNEAGLSDTNNDGLIDGFTDTNGDGYDDNLQGLKPVGKVRTGLDAVGGCVIDTDARFDPTMPLLMLFALLYLLRHTTVSGQRTSVVARRVLSASILGITAMSASTASTAQDQDEFESGLYLGAGVGFSHVKPDTDKTGFEVDEEIDFGWKVFLGYDYSKRISFEAHYADLGEATLKPQGSVDYSVYGLSGLYRFGQKGDNEKNDLFTRQGMSYYGKVGVGKMDNEGNNVDFHRVNDIHLFFGVGAEYGYKNGIALRLEADLYDEDAQLFSINLIKRFKKRSRRVASIAPVVVAEPAFEPVEEEVIALAAPVAAMDCQANIDTVLSSGSIHFKTNLADLAPQSHTLLDELAAASMQCAGTQIEIGGHTDSIGRATYNMNLSQQRAEAVLRYLQTAGVSADRLSAVGYGETQPVANNKTRNGRAKNRRIEFTVK
jgi:outer membrane protein OmpA-like peptidoglycan-associated protein